ncbi:pullulanase [Paenibacillus herberti]|uniref:pullulanase n=1 Tax=Paenibacillus herberti TaxID=1619309 RepID=A0A229NU99_9BACL|nr:pullulanase [Paenibacillus herberti]OXM13239.1 pullulanase [Paenibacillus herberti]
MILSAKGKRTWSIIVIFSLLVSIFTVAPVQANTGTAPAPADETVVTQVYTAASPIPENHLRVHYNRTDGNYKEWGLWIFDDAAVPSTEWASGATAFPDGQTDSYGAYVDIPLKEDAKNIGLIALKPANGEKDGGDKKFALASPKMNEVWLKQGSDAVQNFQPVELPADTVRIHYQRDDQSYASYGLWLWDDVKTPSSSWPADIIKFTAGQTDSYGAYMDVQLAEAGKKIGFLITDPDRGDAGKDGGDKRFVSLDPYKHLFIKQGDDTVYVSPFGELPAVDAPPALLSAQVLPEGRLHLNFSKTAGLEGEKLKRELEIKDKSGMPVTISNLEIAGPTAVKVTAAFTVEQAPLKLTYAAKTVNAAVGWMMTDELYAYEGDDLGATYADGGAVLKLWTPTASSVVVNVYDRADATKHLGEVNLIKGDRGVWSVELKPGDLGVSDFKNYFYQYEVTNNDVTKRVLDPYAKSMAQFRANTKGEAADGDTVGKAAIVDLTGTDPADFGYADIKGYEKREDAVIWEIHVRDFTSDQSIKDDLNNAGWGSYDAFKEKVDYIKSLGVTHVQLLPVMAWYYGDEAAMKNLEQDYSNTGNEYNWGYDPHSYFSPDGAYSENPKDPELRIKELKAMIDAIHDAGMGVILDVVYTHMSKVDFLNDIVPNYYAFQDANGAFLGGFGNNLATNHKMAEKLMVDSVKYWFKEYKIDGMRFDMMGDATYGAVQNAYDAAAAINPDALFIGEGWATFAGDKSDPALTGMGATQDWMDKTNSVGVFSDEFRNELKSGFGNEGEPRFITGGARDIKTIFNNIKAQPSNIREDDPGDVVQYTEAHDNLTLFDIIAQATKKDPAVEANNEEIHKRLRLGNMMTLTSQGTGFLHAGQEYGRTKQWMAEGAPEKKDDYHELKNEANEPFGYFIHNSYDSSDAINKFDWQRATNATAFPENVLTRDYTKGIIELRQSSDAFRLGDQELVNKNVTLLEIPEVNAKDLVIAYKSKATDGTGAYYVFINADSRARSLTLSEDLTGGLVVADNDEAAAAGVATPSGFTLAAGSLTIEPLTAVIIKVDSEEEPQTEKRYVQLNYIRPDKDYTDWNMWVWNTGVKNDQINFEGVENGVASVLIEVAPKATSVGFVLRKGTDWSTAKQDIPDDRTIQLQPGEAFTKVNVTSMVRELDIKPSITGPVLDNGTITFYYRDDQLFREGKMDLISDVLLQINGKGEKMTYVPEQELFRYTMTGVAPGTYQYSFAVTQGGVTKEVTDPKNTVNGKSTVSFSIPDVTIETSVSPAAVAAGENAVLKLNVKSTEGVIFREAYLDLTAVGGPAKVKLDTELFEQTIAVKDTVTAGTKSIPVTLVDEFGNKHLGEAKVEVKTRSTAGGKLDFDFDESRMYFVLTDRFMDGDASNNENVDKSHLEAYQGGDFQGLINKLDYIEDLGVNTLWITPIVDNIDFNKGTDFDGKQYGYHGYWAKDFTKLDEHLGDIEKFKELIDKAHDRGIKIMVDVVLNHTGYGLKPGDTNPGVTEEDKARFAGMLRTDGLSADTDAIKGELASLPDFITENPQVREQIIDWQTGWLERAKTSRGDTIDYFRVDTVKHVEETTWKKFKNELTELDPNFKLLGEYYGATADSDAGTLQSGQMDSLLDFSFNDRAKQFVEGDVEAVDVYLSERATKLDNTRMMGQFLSSHDEDGFLSNFVGGDKAKLMAAAALQITAKGQPVIYYGEELGRSGKNAGDMKKGEFSENRSPMPWDKLDEEQKLLSHYQKLMGIRAEHSKVYSKGERISIEASNDKGYMAFINKFEKEQLVTAIGVKTAPQEVTLAVPFAAGSNVKDLYSGKTFTVSGSGKVTFTLPAMADGATVVLAEVKPDEGNNGGEPVEPGGNNGGQPGGNTGGNPGSNTGGNTGTGPTSTKTITDEMLRAGQDKAVVTLGVTDTEVRLPLNASEILGNKPLELTREGVTVLLPSALLKALQQLVPAGETSGASISFKLAEVASQAAATLLSQTGSKQNAKLKLGSKMMEFKLTALSASDKEYKLDRFATPVELTFQADSTLNGKLSGIYFISEQGLQYVGGKLADGRMTTKVGHFSKYAVLEMDKSFTDLSGHWAESAIKELAAKQVVNGTSASLFTPAQPVTRAEFTAMLVRALKLEAPDAANSFTDVPEASWYASALGAASYHGIVKGKGKETFLPNATITREEMALMLVRAYGAQQGSSNSAAAPVLKDIKEVSAWAVKEVQEALSLGLMKGHESGKFAPDASANRAESAQAVFNLMGKLGL